MSIIITCLKEKGICAPNNSHVGRLYTYKLEHTITVVLDEQIISDYMLIIIVLCSQRNLHLKKGQEKRIIIYMPSHFNQTIKYRRQPA